MKLPSHKTVTLVLVLLSATVLLYYGSGYVKGLMEDRALQKAKEIYEEKIRNLNDTIKADKVSYNSLSETAGRQREEQQIKTEKDFALANHSFAVFKSNSAASLREKNATISQILAEKEKDEIVITDLMVANDGLRRTNLETLSAWEASDKKKDAAHNKIVIDLELKYTTCQRWTETLEKKLKRSFLDKVKDFAIPAAAFYLGTKVK